LAQFEQQTADDGICVIRATGELDLAVADQLVRVALDGLASAPAVHLDLGEVTFIDSTGLGSLLRIRNEAAAASKEFRLVRVPAAVSRLLQITGMTDAFEVVGEPDRP
jgi:anti-anti-sigma factor